MTLRRSLFQVYVRDCDAAIARYEAAFGTPCSSLVRDSGDGSVVHAEIAVLGQTIALSERHGEAVAGNTMQFCLHLDTDEEEFIDRAYRVLSVRADVTEPLGRSFYSPRMFSLVDSFGVSWCVFT